jgi:primosomal protein N' (replication factor Y)
MSQYSNGKLVCLHCNTQTIPPKNCPNCQSEKIKGFGIGTERVAEEAARIFNTKVIILDQDKIKKKNNLYNIYQTFETGKASILVCTQAGISLTTNNLYTIGIVNIDSILNMPDWRADEKVYSLISQVIGNKAKEIIIQTYNPENEILNLAANQNYYEYYEKELNQRKLMNYPPFCSLIKLTYKDKDSKKINQSLDDLQNNINKLALNEIKLLTSRKTKINDIYICTISIKIKNNNYKKILLDLVPNNWSIDVDPESLL